MKLFVVYMLIIAYCRPIVKPFLKLFSGSLSPFALETCVRLAYYLYSGWWVFGWWLCSNLSIYRLT